jgi:RHS repeat-associated protein
VYDPVLELYYAKARMYDADSRRFVAEDPVKGAAVNPLTMAPYLYVLDNPQSRIDPNGESAEFVANAPEIAFQLSILDGPLPIGDLIGLGIIAIAAIMELAENDAIAQEAPNISPAIDWDNIPANKKHHILHGSKGSHESGWKKFGIDPNDPNEFIKIVPFLKAAMEEGEKMVDKAPGGGLLRDFTYTIKEQGIQIWLRIIEFADGTQKLSDAGCTIIQVGQAASSAIAP